MFEVAVIGGGPAGVTAALRARELGATVALIESEHMGGVSTNDGCVPTRVLARAARLVRDAEQFADFGLEGEPPKVDFVRLLNHTEQIVRTVHEKKQLQAQLEAADVRVFDGVGAARFLDSHTLALANGNSVQGEKFILCVGGHARRIPLPGSEHALTHSDVWTMKGLPESVAVVGAAATGCQLASVFAAFGSRVRLLEVSPRILAAEDEAVSEGVAEAFERRGIEIVTGIGGVEKVERENGHLSLLYAKNDQTHTLAAETIMFAVGWSGNVEGLNLEAVGVETRRGGYVQVDDSLRTSAQHIFADGHTEGFCKLLVDRASRRILGAHIVGEQAVEVVQIVATAMRAGMPVEQLADVEFAYPTFTAIVGIAARRALRELGLVAVSPRWGIPERTLGAEWEHSDRD